MVPPLSTSLSGLAAASGMVYRTHSSEAQLREALSQLRDAEQRSFTPRSPLKNRMHPSVARQAATRRRRRLLLSRLLAAAIVVAALSGMTSYRMHVTEHAAAAWGEEPGDSWDGGGGAGSAAAHAGALAGLRSWLTGSRGGTRRSLREGLPGLDDDGLPEQGAAHAADPGAHAHGVVQFERWWFVDGFTQLSPSQQQQQQQQQQEQQQLFAIEQPGSDGAAGAGGDAAQAAGTPVQRLQLMRRLQPSAFRMYDLKQKSWVAHNITRIPMEVPLARWAVASLLNKAKKKESIIFLVGGYAAPREVATGRPPRPPRTDAAASALHTAGGAAADGAAACPLASAAVFAVNPGRSRFRALPPLPEARYGGAAVVVGARLHFLGGWATPNRTERLAAPSDSHWSIGLNADGSSAPDWHREPPLPPQLVGRRLQLLSLAAEEDGEPGMYAWTDGSGDSPAPGGGEAACYAEPAAGGFGSGSSGRAVQVWAYARSTGWHRGGPMPEPLAADVQCIVPASPHELLAVGSAERSGLFSQHRGVWQFDARPGGGWSRVGWAPVQFEGALCALYHNRIFTSKALPPEPAPSPPLELGSQADALAAGHGRQSLDAAGTAAAEQQAGAAGAAGRGLRQQDAATLQDDAAGVLEEASGMM